MKEEKNIYQELYNAVVAPGKVELCLVERMEKIARNLEQVAKHEARSFSSSGKAALRYVQLEVYRITLLLRDKVSKPKPQVCYY